MSFIRNPRFWLAAASFAAAFWITFRVVTADAAPPAPLGQAAHDDEVRDPALERLIAGFAAEARQHAK